MTSEKAGGQGFSEAEREAMQARAAELRAEAENLGRGKAKARATNELGVLDAIAAMDEHDRLLAEQLHAIITRVGPELEPKLWYSQPAHARDGKVLCFFRSGIKDGERYSTFGFSAEAALDSPDGLWPTSYALTAMTPAAASAIEALVRSALAK